MGRFLVYHRFLKMATLAAPVKVSPLIKLCRWTLLTAGIYYGAKRHNELLGIMKEEREEYFKNCEIEKEELAIERAKINREEMIYLAKETGTKIPDGNLGGEVEDRAGGENGRIGVVRMPR